MKKNILVLGADGMVGQTVFSYLNSQFPNNVWRTTKIGKNSFRTFYLSAKTIQKDFKKVKNKLKHIEFIINCVGITNESKPIQEMIFVNALFPHILECLAEKNNCKLIHISTDAVFAPLSGAVGELSPVSPDTTYAKSKLLGETISENAITIRSSFIGLDELNHHGFLEKIKLNKTFFGYTNQTWTGCTTLQFARFCGKIIKNNSFQKLRNNSNIFHFAPLGPISKYELAKTFVGINKLKITVKKTQGNKITRNLKTDYFDLLEMSKYTNDVNSVFLESNEII